MVRCGCASDTCTCTVVAGDGIVVGGAGSPSNPYLVSAAASVEDVGVAVEKDNVSKVTAATTLDFRGAGVSVASGGLAEAVVTIAGGAGGGETIPAGTMVMFGGVAAPTGWLLCDGTSYPVVNYSNLWAAIGDRFGGDGGNNFKVPNMADLFPIGASVGKPVGTAGKGGASTKTIGVANLPPHTHTISHTHTLFSEYFANTSASGSSTRITDIGNKTGASGTNISPVTSEPSVAASGPVGGGTPIDVMPPYLPFTFIIKAT